MRAAPIVLVLLALGLRAGHAAGEPSSGRAEVPAEPVWMAGTNSAAAVPEPDWFPVGEQLVYKLYWGWIPVGKTRVVTRWVEVDGVRLIAIRYRTRSNSVLSKLYPVDDVIESLIDPKTFLPVRFVKNLSEGRHRYHEVTTFDHANLKANWLSIRRKREAVYDIREDTRDLVTFMYYMRAQAFEVGKTLKHEVMADDKIYDLLLKVTRNERIKLSEFGRVDTVRVDPEAQFNGLFVRKGKLVIWISKGDRVLCAKMEADTPFANVHAVLTEVHGPGDDFWTRKTKERAKKRGEEKDPEVEKALRELDEDQPESLKLP